MKKIVETLYFWQRRAKMRKELRNRSDHLLKDIGLTRAQVNSDYNKRFWQD